MAGEIGTISVGIEANVEPLTAGLKKGEKALDDFSRAAAKPTAGLSALDAKFKALDKEVTKVERSLTQLEKTGAAAKAPTTLGESFGKLNTSMGALNKSSRALNAVGIGLDGDDVKIVNQVGQGLSILAAGPWVAGFAAVGVAAAALRTHLKGIQEDINKGAAADEAFGRLEVAIARANARGIELTSEMRKAVLEGKSFEEVFKRVEVSIGTAASKFSELGLTVAGLPQQFTPVLQKLDEIRSFDIIDQEKLVQQIGQAVTLVEDELEGGFKFIVDEPFFRANLDKIAKLPKEVFDKIPEDARKIIALLDPPDVAPALKELDKIPPVITTVHRIVTSSGVSGPPISSAAQRDLARSNPAADMSQLSESAIRAVEAGQREAYVTASGDTRTRLVLPPIEQPIVPTGPEGMSLEQMYQNVTVEGQAIVGSTPVNGSVTMDVNATGSPLMPFTDYFTSYAPQTIREAMSKLGQQDIAVFTGLQAALTAGASLTADAAVPILSSAQQLLGALQQIQAYNNQPGVIDISGPGRASSNASQVNALATELQQLMEDLQNNVRRDEAAEERRHSTSIATFRDMSHRLERIETATRQNTEEAQRFRTGWTNGSYIPALASDLRFYTTSSGG